MKLTNNNKKRIFSLILGNYSEHERNRNQAKRMFFYQHEKLREILKIINQEEKQDYDLLVQFGKELNQAIPNYKEVDIEEFIKE